MYWQLSNQQENKRVNESLSYFWTEDTDKWANMHDSKNAWFEIWKNILSCSEFYGDSEYVFRTKIGYKMKVLT